MKSEEIEYPIYRKYVGIDTWFKITSDKTFIEIKKVGSKMVRVEVKAIQYPEMLFIQDMITCNGDRWEPCGSEMFQ